MIDLIPLLVPVIKIFVADKDIVSIEALMIVALEAEKITISMALVALVLEITVFAAVSECCTCSDF